MSLRHFSRQHCPGCKDDTLHIACVCIACKSVRDDYRAPEVLKNPAVVKGRALWSATMVNVATTRGHR